LRGYAKLQLFTDLNNQDKNELILRTASLKKISPILVEKDFWVTWLLNKLFSLDISSSLTFKGGTSLSKCYGLINRFSEDCDITIDKTIFIENIKDKNLSNKKFQKLLDENDIKAIHFVQNLLKPQLEENIKSSLPHNSKWELALDVTEPKNLRFFYPSILEISPQSYIKKSILLESGIRGEINPSEKKTVISFVETQFPDLLKTDQVQIRTLSPLRTFWEKITLLHAENNKPLDKKRGDRTSRHYYDVYQLLKTDIPDKSIESINILFDVIDNKKRFFRTSWAKYETAIPGTLTITPKESLLSNLKVDYKQMELMIYGEIPEFKDIIKEITHFEKRFNLLKI
jgi:predicted nucleotidyltransferase component of viral defense system